MARQSTLSDMTVDQLFTLRDGIDKVLSEKRVQLQRSLQQLSTWSDGTRRGSTGKRRPGRPAGTRSALKGKKVEPKYRNPDNQAETWAGRGATPRWLKALLGAGRKIEEFTIGAVTTLEGKTGAGKRKRGRPKKAA
jgi:DNA-binding protein H-NS